MTVHGGVPSWRFKEAGGDWPFVQIVSPCDFRLVTRPADAAQVPRPGDVEIVAKLFGQASGPSMLSVGRGAATPMTRGDDGSWSAMVSLDPSLHRVEVAADDDRDVIDLLICGREDVPRRNLPVALGHDVHAIGQWAEHGIEGMQLGPNKNGKHW